MIYIVNNSNDPAYNIALEEYAFKKLLNHDQVFILWINKPAIIVGRHQNTIEEVNQKYVRENNIEVVRRISGGGAVYHDLGNLNFTIISKENEEAAFDFKTFSKPVIETLSSLGVKAEFTGRNDLEIDGKKFCGNAQAYITGRLMHHGCLLFDTDLTVLGKALQVSKDKIESKGVKSVRSRVTNITDELPNKISIEEFKDLLMEYMKKNFENFEEYVLNSEEKEKIQETRDTKFGTWDWSYGKSPKYNVTRFKRYPAGKIEIFATIENSIIKNIKFYGDFFGAEDLTDFENNLIGMKYNYQDILEGIKNIETSKYFAGISKEEISSAISE